MQTVATYLLERGTQGDDVALLKAYGAEAAHAVESWLNSKGATATSPDSGTYRSLDGSAATYQRKSAHDGDRTWDLLALEEVSSTDRIFRTSVSVTVGSSNVAVFVTMQVGTTGDNLTRVDARPKCPGIVRELLSLPGDWYHGGSPLQNVSLPVIGEAQGEYVATLLRSESRAIPYVLVSSGSNKEQQAQVSDELAFELAGLANVLFLDDAASWALTQTLGKAFSVFDGAIRIYWPHVDEANDSPFKHQLWTASRLEAAEKKSPWFFRNSIRRILMDASSASVSRPQEIDGIRNAEASARYAELVLRSKELESLKSQASSLADYENLADSYASDNDLLRDQVEQRDSRIIELENELESARHDQRALRYRLDQAQTAQNKGENSSTSLEDQDDEYDEAYPVAGDVHFYKKTHSGPSHDFLEKVGGCSHSAWQSSNGADKARKGLKRLGLPEWKKLQHCGSCTGGGMWRVEW